MNRSKRFFRSLIAVFVAVLMIGTTAPVVSQATETVVTEESSPDIFALFSKLVENFYEFIRGIISFFSGGMQGDLFEEEVVVHKISTEEELRAAFMTGGEVYLLDSIECDGVTSLEIPEGVDVILNLRGFSITNPIDAAPAIVNYGDLVVYGDGAIVNGTNAYKDSHTIENFGNLSINGGNIGTFDTAGAAIKNNGIATIYGGTFASRQETVKAEGRCAYVFINQKGSMVIYNATVNGRVHGLFGVYGGTITVNGGTYVLDGNGGLGCYVAYATGEGEVILNGGTVYTNSPGNNRVFYVYSDGDKFDQDAVYTENITYIRTVIYKDGQALTFAEK